MLHIRLEDEKTQSSLRITSDSDEMNPYSLFLGQVLLNTYDIQTPVSLCLLSQPITIIEFIYLCEQREESLAS